MSNTVQNADDAPKKGGMKGILIGLILAVILGAGGFYAIYSGMILSESEEMTHTEVTEDIAPVSFVAINPMVISLGQNKRHQLRFIAQLEVDPARAADVSNLMPRIVDVLNGYLRAVEISELEDPAALIRLRAQMLRRVQLVTGEGHVRDLLIMEFVFT